MCSDLDNRAEKYMRSVMNNDGDVFSRSDLYEYIIEAYKQGYRDANKLVCCNRECNQRIPPRPYRVGDKVIVSFQNGDTKIGYIAEVKWNGWCDIDFGDGCMRYDVPPCEFELYSNLKDSDK